MSRRPAPARHPDYFEGARELPRQDFWRQVRRTVGGRAVDEDQIQMIVDAIVTGLQLSPGDVLLDLACGNGALSARVSFFCDELIGIDYSDYLISVAEEYFAKPPRQRFLCQDVASFVEGTCEAGRFTKILCYGSFAYFTPDDATSMLRGIADRFDRVTTVLLGNLPDRRRARDFYSDGEPPAPTMDSPTSAVGIWRTEEDVTELANSCGWHASFQRMPDNYYAAHYRFDAILTRS